MTENKSDYDKRDVNIFWKLKGIVAKSTYWLIIKYGNPSIYENDKSKEFAQEFLDLYSV